LIAFRDAERSVKEKPLESFGQWCVFSDQILQLRLQNDTNFSTPHIFYIAIRASPVFAHWRRGDNRHK
ncbi:MAG TPA: hypothetical protein QF520_13955, partial [SAR202 cluster bacterium]|nr:hypothetical protein [SAR202 cluster bacterium]